MELKLRDDLLRGVSKIAEYIGENQRRTNHLLAMGILPGRKDGLKWVSKKSVIDRHYSIDVEPTEAAAEAEDDEAAEKKARRREDGEEEEAVAETPEAA